MFRKNWKGRLSALRLVDINKINLKNIHCIQFRFSPTDFNIYHLNRNIMKIKSILLGCTVGTFFMIIFPLITIFINNYFNLPIYRNSVHRITGFLLCIIGISIFLYCSNLFAKIGRGTPAPIEPPKKLVAEGLYHFTRNPIYVGYFLIFLGEFFIFGHSLLLIYSLITISLLHFYVVYVEEPNLKKRFGDTYIKYTEKVSRWFLKI